MATRKAKTVKKISKTGKKTINMKKSKTVSKAKKANKTATKKSSK